MTTTTKQSVNDNEALVEIDETFGSCPECGRHDGFINIHRDHWFFCHEHQFKWCAGANLFGCWRMETLADWWRACDFLESYREVQPVYNLEDLRQCKDAR